MREDYFDRVVKSYFTLVIKDNPQGQPQLAAAIG
jgi:hypothetical protein